MCQVDYEYIHINEITKEMGENSKIIKVYAMIKEKMVRTKKDNALAKYFDINIMDGTGIINLKIWDYDEIIDAKLKPGLVVQLIAKVSSWKGKEQLELVNEEGKNKIRVAHKDEFDYSSFVESVPGITPEFMKDKYRDAIFNIKTQHLKNLLVDIFSNEEISEAFFRNYAGKSVHHTYLCGLSVHSDEVADYAVYSAKLHKLSERQQDIVQVIARLHDIGKIKEYSPPPFVEITVEGRLFGHLHIGASIVEKFIDCIPNFPIEDKYAIIHGILSHHGKLEDGAVTVPCMLESVIVYEADRASSQVEGVIDFISKDTNESGITDFCFFKKQFFVKDINHEIPQNNKPIVSNLKSEESNCA